MKPPSETSPTGLLGRAPSIVRIRSQIERIGNSRVPVLIVGETGTGKEVAARSVYHANPRGRFVTIDCGAIVSSLLETELFGHTRYAFTGAGEAKKGLIEHAHGGTAFLDEIGDLPLELQVKLLRLLDENAFRPVGSLHTVSADVRIVAATHRNLEAEVAAGRFRADLFHRLNVVRIALPPLRERKQDLPMLIEHFLTRRLPHRYSLTNETMEALLRYDWPGNVRELRNCLDRMAALASGSLLHLDDLPTAIFNHRLTPRLSTATAAAGPPRGLSGAITGGPVSTIQELERQAIAGALRQTGGDRSEAARLLGIGRTTIYRKMREYSFDGRTDNAKNGS